MNALTVGMSDLLASWVRCCVARSRVRRSVQVLFVGPPEAGKTALMHQATWADEAIEDSESFRVQLPDLDLVIRKVGGLSEFRRRCYAKVEALAFVVDSTTQGRLKEAREMLKDLLALRELRHCRLMVLANKQDVPGAKSIDDVSRALKLQEIRDRRWVLQATSAEEAFGVEEIFDWLQDELRDTPEAAPPAALATACPRKAAAEEAAAEAEARASVAAVAATPRPALPGFEAFRARPGPPRASSARRRGRVTSSIATYRERLAAVRHGDCAPAKDAAASCKKPCQRPE